MSATPTYLRGWERVVAAFGYWPAFHDAKLREVRRSSEGAGAIELLLHGWESTAEVDARGYFRTIKHHVVRFRFEAISEEALDELRRENVLFALGFSPVVEPDGLLGASQRCRRLRAGASSSRPATPQTS